MTAEPSSRDSPDEDRDGAEELLFECLERIELEGEGAIDELLAAHPEHAETVRARLVALRGVGLVGKAHPDRIPERLGGGGMGVVYLAEQESLGRRVALKLIRPEHLYFPGSRERFRREVRAVALMQHPGIVPVYTVGEEDGVPYFAMERIEGCTLAEVLEHLSTRAPSDLQGRDLVEAIGLCSDPAPEGEEPPRPPFGGSWTDACLQLVRQVALALTHAHARGVLHRDVKSSNIAIDRSGRAMLLDFGLASAEGADHLTRSGSQPGSLPYMSPEQVRGERELDARTDVYSLGVTLYELLTLRRPFAAETTELVRSRILEGAAPGVRRLNRGVPWDVETVCLTAIERRREDRYPGVAGLARDLENLMGRRPIEARRPGPWLRLLRWAQRHPTASVGSALVLALAAIALGLVAWQQKLHGDQLERRGIELQEQRDIARQRFEEMRKQATSLLFELHDSIQFLAGSTRARELLVGRAIELLERLSEVAEEEPELKSELAVAYAKLGDILGNPQMSSLGDLEGAQVQYEKAMSLFDQALAANPTEWRLKKNRCEAIGCLALVAQARGDLEAEASWLERGTRAAEELYENHPAQLTRLDVLGRNLQLRSQFLMRAGRGDEAMECTLRAVELYEELGRDLPGDADTEMKLALALGESARILTAMGHQLEARENLERALALWEDRIGADPDNAWIRGVRSRDQLLLSGVQSAMGEGAEALENARVATAEVEALVASDPRNAECKRQLQFALLTCGPLALSFGEVGEAIEHLERALHVGEEVLALGEDVSATDLNRYGRIQLARAYLSRGRSGGLPRAQPAVRGRLRAGAGGAAGERHDPRPLRGDPLAGRGGPSVRRRGARGGGGPGAGRGGGGRGGPADLRSAGALRRAPLPGARRPDPAARPGGRGRARAIPADPRGGPRAGARPPPGRGPGSAALRRPGPGLAARGRRRGGPRAVPRGARVVAGVLER